MLRCFLSIALSDDVADALEEIQHHLPVGRITPAENLHLTLAFLGDCSPQMLQALDGELSSLSAAAFDLHCDGLGTFGSASPKLLFARVQPAPPLVDLHRWLAMALRRAGFDLPRERFRPHVTLARFPRGLRGNDLLRFQDFLADHVAAEVPPWRATGVQLMQSTLLPDGARYDELACYPLHQA